MSVSLLCSFAKADTAADDVAVQLLTGTASHALLVRAKLVESAAAQQLLQPEVLAKYSPQPLSQQRQRVLRLLLELAVAAEPSDD